MPPGAIRPKTRFDKTFGSENTHVFNELTPETMLILRYRADKPRKMAKKYARKTMKIPSRA